MPSVIYLAIRTVMHTFTSGFPLVDTQSPKHKVIKLSHTHTHTPKLKDNPWPRGLSQRGEGTVWDLKGPPSVAEPSCFSSPSPSLSPSCSFFNWRHFFILQASGSGALCGWGAG